MAGVIPAIALFCLIRIGFCGRKYVCADELAVLDDGAAAHLCVKDRTKFCTNLFQYAQSLRETGGFYLLRANSVCIYAGVLAVS